jgi:hypothetical protein
MGSYHEAIENHRMADLGRFRSPVVTTRAAITQSLRRGRVRIGHLGWIGLRTVLVGFGLHFDRLEKIPPGGATNGPISRAWPIVECKFYFRVLSHAVNPLGKIASNPIKQLYSADRSEVIWTDSDIALSKRRARRKCRNGAACSATPASSPGPRAS